MPNYNDCVSGPPLPAVLTLLAAEIGHIRGWLSAQDRAELDNGDGALITAVDRAASLVEDASRQLCGRAHRDGVEQALISVLRAGTSYYAASMLEGTPTEKMDSDWEKVVKAADAALGLVPLTTVNCG